MTVAEADKSYKTATNSKSPASSTKAYAEFGVFMTDQGLVSMTRAKIYTAEQQVEDTMKMCDKIFKDTEDEDKKMLALRIKTQLLERKIDSYRVMLMSASKEVRQPGEEGQQTQSFAPGAIVQAQNAQVNVKS